MVVLRITNSRYCCGRLQPLPAGFPPYTPTAILQRDFPINRMALSTLTKGGVMRRSRVKRKRNNAGSTASNRAADVFRHSRDVEVPLFPMPALNP